MCYSCLIFRKTGLGTGSSSNLYQIVQKELQILSNFSSKQTTKLKGVEQCVTYITIMASVSALQFLFDNYFIEG